MNIIRTTYLGFRKFLLLSFGKGKIRLGKKMDFGGGFKLTSLNHNGSVSIGDNFSTRRNVNLLVDGGNLIVGSGVFFNNNCSVNCMGSIQIGNDCLFGENVKFYDHNHIFSELDKNISEQGFDIGKIIIGNNCWFGSNVTILNNVTIGNNVVIGANVLIFKSIPSNAIVTSKSELVIRHR